MPTSPALAAAIRSATPESLGRAGGQDAIVVGSGAAGGLAALLLAEAGLRVLVLDAGLPRSPFSSPRRWLRDGLIRAIGAAIEGEMLPSHLVPQGRTYLGALGKRQQIQSHCYAWARAPELFVDDLECPYVTPPDRPFVWVRVRSLGGRMVVPDHGLQYYRLGPDDFAPADGLSPAWPLQMGELNPWYALVERRIGLSGGREGLPWLPDGELVKVLEHTASEAALLSRIAQRWPEARAVIGRHGRPTDFLGAAALTGRLRCRRGAIVREIDVDSLGRVRGVVWHDRQTGKQERAHAPLVFLCASALESTRLLLLSRSPRNPGGLGARSSVLGRGLMDHINVYAAGVGPPLSSDVETPARRRCIYLPRFDARERALPGPGRGYGVQVYQRPRRDGRSSFSAGSFGEMLPRAENFVTLDPVHRDAWGIPVLRIDCSHSPAELAQAREQAAALRALADLAEVILTQSGDMPALPGAAIHECGTARMGRDPTSSVLDPYNQCWDAEGLYVTDGACFPSQGAQNPTLTILALTARACDHALTSARRATD